MSNYVIRPEEQNTYSLTPLPGVDQTLLTEIGETIYVPLATENTYGVVKPGTGVSVTNGVLNVDKSEIGLDNVDNTHDLDKPISTATQAALNLKVSGIKKHAAESTLEMDADFIVNLDLKKADVGLNNVDNTADVDKPVSTATRTELDKIINNIVPIKASNGSVQLGEGSNTTANTLQFRSFNFINANGELQTFTGSVMTKVADIDWTGNQIKANVVDNLTTTATDKALSAKQGKILKDLVDGKQQTETYETISAMVTALNSASSTQFKQGYNFYIIDTEVPDFWVTEVESMSSTYTYTTDAALVNAVKQAPVQIGHYKVSLLETAKVETKDAVDNSSITRNVSDELQTVGVIDQKTGNAIKTWTGTLDDYNALLVKDNNTDYIITDDENEIGIIPDSTSDLINDSGFITKDVDNLTNYTKTSSLGALATKNSVNYETEVTNKPTINNGTLTIQKNGTTVATFSANQSSDVTANILADTQEQADWNQSNSSKPDYIKNKPSINNGILTIQKNGTTVATFSANQSSNVTANILADTQLQTDWNQSDSEAADYLKNKPTKVSDFTNDSGFIINTVNDLTNYYLKSETYTQSEVNSLIGAIKTIKAEVVVELPTASADTYFNESKTIYLVAYTGSRNDYYNEYITVRTGTEGSYTYSWEKIGNTQIDLSNYVQKTTTIAGVDLQDNITKSELQTALDLVTTNTEQTITSAKYTDVLFPRTTGRNIGASTSRYATIFSNNLNVLNDVQLGGNLTDGTNSISVANIENKTDYTKVTALTGSSAPTTSTVANFEGQLYHDTTNNKLYICDAITTENNVTTYTWTQLIRVTDYATSNDFGVVKTNKLCGTTASNGILMIEMANANEIADRTAYKTICGSNLNNAVKAALSDNSHLTMTDTEKTTAQSVLGVNLLTGSAAPTTSTVGRIGQLYKDTTNDKWYVCDTITEDTSTTPSTFTYTWTQVIRVTDRGGYGTNGVFGVSGVPDTYGINFMDYGGARLLIIQPATTSNITARDTRAAITPTNLNFAVKSALTDTNHLTMTSAEQTVAQSVLNVSPRVIARL